MSETTPPTVLITGATSGIGYETALRLALAGSAVIVHGPTAVSVSKAVARLSSAGADPSKLDTVVADFARPGEVAAMAFEIRDKYRHLDVLVNNAAMAGPAGRQTCPDGHEVTFQVNYLAPYLLTRLLLNLLGEAKQGRVINVSSVLHRTANINWADPQRVKNYSPVAAYSQSKLALTMFTRAMSAKEPGIAAVSVHPGIADTSLMSIYSRTGDPAAQCAGPVASLCTAELSSGSFYDQFQVAAPAALVDNRSAVDRLWKLSGSLTGLDRQGTHV